MGMLFGGMPSMAGANDVPAPPPPPPPPPNPPIMGSDQVRAQGLAQRAAAAAASRGGFGGTIRTSPQGVQGPGEGGGGGAQKQTLGGER